MSWKTRLASSAVLLATIVGCTRQVYLSEAERDSMLVGGKLPTCAELTPPSLTHPLPGHDFGSPYPTVIDTLDSRDTRYLSLAEAIALALEQGHEGSAGLTGVDNLSLNGLTPESVEDSIRAFALEPAIAQASIEAALSKFDVRYSTSMNWTTTDQQVGTSAEIFQAGGASAIRSQDATLTSSLIKPLATGGTAGITYTVPYTFTNTNSPVNPAYRPDLLLSFEQPLLKGFGVDINQITAAHPGSTLTPFITGITSASGGIVITRLQADQQRAEFERHVHNMLANVEVSYWNLYAQYWTLYAQEAGLRQTWETWKVTRAKFQAGLATEADVEEARAQFELFRSSRLDALYQVIENERVLRDLLGLPLADGTRLVPSDTPTVAGYHPDPQLANQQALALRPELIEAREQLKFRQIDMMRAHNDFLPDLRFQAQYGINGLGSRLDGSSPQNALFNQMSNHYDNWLLGLNLTVPLGRRDAAAGERIARLRLAQVLIAVQGMEEKAAHFAAQQYGNVLRTHEQITIRRNRRDALSKEVQARFQQWQAGKITLDILLTAQQDWAAALNDEAVAIRDYNNALILFEYAKGTIMVHDNVTIAEGPLPSCVAKRAADHARDENRGIVLRERAQPVMHCRGSGECEANLPELPEGEAVSLPSLLEKAPKFGRDLPEQLESTPVSAPARPANDGTTIDLFSPLPK